MRFEKSGVYLFPEDAKELIGKRVVYSDSPTELRTKIETNNFTNSIGELELVSDRYNAFAVANRDKSSTYLYHCVYWTPLLDVAYANFVEDKEVQILKDDGTWEDAYNLSFDSAELQYRIKPDDDYAKSSDEMASLKRRIEQLEARVAKLEE